MPAVGIPDGPPPCTCDHQAVVLSCSHPARRWVALEHRSAWLVIDAQVKVCSKETHSPSRESKIYGHKAFQNNSHTHHCYQQLSRIHYSTPHTPGGCTGELALVQTVAIILADAAVTPPKWPKIVSSKTLNPTIPYHTIRDFFQGLSRTDPEVAFSRTNSRRKFTARSALQQCVISISVITGQF